MMKVAKKIELEINCECIINPQNIHTTHHAAMNDINEKIKQTYQTQQLQQLQQLQQPHHKESYEIRDPHGILELLELRRSRL